MWLVFTLRQNGFNFHAYSKAAIGTASRSLRLSEDSATFDAPVRNKSFSHLFLSSSVREEEPAVPSPLGGSIVCLIVMRVRLYIPVEASARAKRSNGDPSSQKNVHQPTKQYSARTNGARCAVWPRAAIVDRTNLGWDVVRQTTLHTVTYDKKQTLIFDFIFCR